MSSQTARKTSRAAPKPKPKAPPKPAAKKRTPRIRTLPGDGIVLYSVEEVANRLNIGRTVAYRLVGTGIIESLKVSGLRRITTDALERYVAETQMLTARKRSA